MTKTPDKTPANTQDPADKPADDAGAPTPAAPAAKDPVKSTWLVALTTDEHGPAGRFVELTETEAKAAPAGVLVKPTREQLALRVQ